MELAAIITTLVVVILQIITITLVVGTRKIVRDQAMKHNPNFLNDKAGDKKDRDFRNQNKKPVQDQKKSSQQPTSTGSVDTVEKSLRDINLKLKNAERDQEYARRKVQENFSKDANRRNGNDRNNKGGRDHRHGHDRNNRDRRGGANWQERNKAREPLTFGTTSQSDEALNIENQNTILSSEQTLNNEPVAQTQEPAIVTENTPDLIPSDFSSDENLQHGRKILVKRRMLKEDENQPSVENSDINSTDFSSSSVSETSNSEEISDVKTSEGEIKFGRR